MAYRFNFFGTRQSTGVGPGETRNSDVSGGPQTHLLGTSKHDLSKQAGNWAGIDLAEDHPGTKASYPVNPADTHAGNHGRAAGNRQYAIGKAGAVGATAKQSYPFKGDDHAGTHGKAGGNRRYAYGQLGNYTGGQRTDFMKEETPSEEHWEFATGLANGNRPSSSSFPAPETVREHSSGHGGASQNWLAVTRKGKAAVRAKPSNQAGSQAQNFPSQSR